MKSNLILAALILFTVISCRKKSSDDYNYYQPYKSDSIAAVDTTPVQNPNMNETETDIDVAEEIKGVDLNDSYFLVVASYTVKDYANAQKQDLIEQGYKPEVFMVDEDGWYKLAVESYKTLDEAKEALSILQKKSDVFSQVRIVFKKNK